MKFIVFFLLIAVSIRCTTKKEATYIDGYYTIAKSSLHDAAVQTALYDFICSERSKDSVFSISIYDPPVVLRWSDERGRWVLKKQLDELIMVRILPFYDLWMWVDSTEVKDVSSNIPNRFLTIDNKFFYWEDDNYPVIKEVIDAFDERGLLFRVSDIEEYIEYMDKRFQTAEYLPGVDYFFCKNNLSIYKKMRFNKRKSSRAPKIRCKTKKQED